MWSVTSPVLFASRARDAESVRRVEKVFSSEAFPADAARYFRCPQAAHNVTVALEQGNVLEVVRLTSALSFNGGGEPCVLSFFEAVFDS